MRKAILVIIIIYVALITNKEETIEIPKESIRFRIIANSNSYEDQSLKLKIVEDLNNNYFPYVNGNNITETRQLIEQNNNKLNNIINKYTNNYNINYGNNYFPEKEYRGIKYNKGEYESLVVSLGSGTGENFWCVLFPPLCLLDGTNKNTNDVEYKILIKELLSNQ